jgi:biotin operon repressor
MSALRYEATYGTAWSAGDDAELRADYGRVPTADLAERFGRGVLAVRQRARLLGLAKPPAARITWTAAADATLRAGYRRLPTAELAATLGATVEAVWFRARQLGLATPTRHGAWTDDDDTLLRDLYGAVSLADLAARLGRSRSSIGNRLKRLGLTRETAVTGRQARDQAEITRLRAGALDAAHAPAADARRLAVLIAYRLNVIDAAEAAVVLGVPPARLLVEVAKAAKLGQDITHAALEGA